MLHKNSGNQFLFWWLASIFLFFSQRSEAFNYISKGKIVFSTQEELRIINLGDKSSWKNPATLTMPYVFDAAHHPSWMPSGDGIIFEYSSIQKRSKGLMKKYLAEVDTNGNRTYSWEKHMSSKKGGLSYPKWSPNGRYLAVLDFEKLFVGKEDDDGHIRDSKDYYALIVFDNKKKVTKRYNNIHAKSWPISWSWDSKKVAYTTSDREIAVYDLDQNAAIILDKGDRPVFHPISGQIYYVGLDTHLYRIDIDGKKHYQVDAGDWSWFPLIGFSGDGKNLFYIGGGSFLMREYSTIEVFNLSSHKKKRISRRYGVIHGASLFEPE